MRAHIPKYRRHRASGQAVVTLSGRDVYLGRYDSPGSRKLYKEAIADWIASGDGLRASGPGGLSTNGQLIVGHVALAWLESYAKPRYVKGLRVTGQMIRARRAVEELAREHGELLAHRFGADHLLQIRERLVKAGLARPYINSLCGVIRQLWAWAATADGGNLVPPGQAHALRLLRSLTRNAVVKGARVQEGVEVMPAIREHVEVYLTWLPPIVADLFRVQLLAGMRPCEVCGMRPADIDRTGKLRDGTMFPGLWVYDVADQHNKNAHRDQARVVLLGPLAQAILQPYMNKPELSYLFSPAETVRQLGHEIGQWKRLPGELYGADALAHAVRRAFAQQQKRGPVLPLWRPNQLRHLRATEIRSRYDGDCARVVLGHRLPGITGRYAHDDLQKGALVMREIG